MFENIFEKSAVNRRRGYPKIRQSEIPSNLQIGDPQNQYGSSDYSNGSIMKKKLNKHTVVAYRLPLRKYDYHSRKKRIRIKKNVLG